MPVITDTETPTPTPVPTDTETPAPPPLPTETGTPTETATAEPTQTATTMGYLPIGGKVLAVYVPASREGGQLLPISPSRAMQQTQANTVVVTVQDTNGEAKSGLKVYVFDGSTYIGINGMTDAGGQAAFTLPDGGYRFRADFNGTQFWSDAQNHCAVPECTAATVAVTIPVTVTALDTDGAAKAGLKVYAFDGTTYTNHSAMTDANGAAVFTLLPGSYRFRADLNGTQFWSGAENHCAIPGCTSVGVTVTLPVTVTVQDTDGAAKEGLKVYAFDGITYTNHSATTDASGAAAFTLPQGSYRFRADLNGTYFWSGAENHCTLPGCGSASVTVTKPVTVTVAGKTGNPYPGLRVYAFTGAVYSGYHATTDTNGKVTLTLPAGNYRFRADYDPLTGAGGVQFWSSEMELCVLPGCTVAAVTLPGGIGQMDVTIDYQYDALNRLTRASYSNGTIFQYTYDPAGNVLEYVSTIDGQTVTTTYEYNDANQMVAARASNTEAVWQYTYDGNGSLVQSSSGGSPAEGAKRYTYNAAGFLVKVEAYGGGWQDQAQMAYDGLGRRLEMTGYADGQSVTTQYIFDDPLTGTGGQPLVASAADLETTYLYGLGPIAELTDSWAYSLPDGTNTPRQLTSADGEVTFTASYTPWGDTLAVSGTGNFTFGYFGGVMDAATGLLYVGNGQYYDPSTGRFLTRDARYEQTNPYVPWKADASALLIAPLVLLSLVYSRRRGKRTRWDGLLIIVVLCVSVSMGLAACSGNQQEPTSHTVTITQAPFGTVIALDGTDIGSVGTPAGTVFNTPKIVCWMTFEPTSNTMLTAYGITLEPIEDWTPERINAIYDAVQNIGYRLSNLSGGTNIGAYKRFFNPVTIIWCGNGGGSKENAWNCHYYGTDHYVEGKLIYAVTSGGYTPPYPGDKIYFYTMSPNPDNITKNVIHELGHVLDYKNHISNRIPGPSKDKNGNEVPNLNFTRNVILRSNEGPGLNWQQHPCDRYPYDCKEGGELFADMFIAWVYNGWNTNPRNKDYVDYTKKWMGDQIIGRN